MAFAYDHEADFWGVLINPDKSPSPLLEQLCLGIAQLMTTFDNYTISDLTPERLATFYRKVGGNYDILFLETKPSALSFIYQRLGCFHSIQPSADPYRPPSIPALQPHGFVRWQTIQLLLDPDEHVAYLQNAVERWNIFSPTGAVFPKSIPREAFPAEPDPEMVLWHQTVSQKFEFDYWRKNLVRSSPPNFGSYHDQFQKGSPTSTKKDEFAQSYHPRASNYRASVPADPQLSRRHHQRRRSAEVPPRSSHKKSQSSLPRRSAEFVGAYVSPRAPTPPSAVKQQTKSRGRERKPYPRPTGPKPAHGHSSSDASSEDSVTPRQEPASTPSRSARRHLSPAHPPHARRHSHEAYSRRPRRDLSPDSQKRYAYRDALHAKTGRVYDSDSGRGVRKQPGDYIDEVRQSRTPGPQLQDPVYRESTTVPTSPAHGPIHSVHPIHPVHPRFVNVSDPSYLMHPQADLDANVVEDPRRTACRNGSLTPTPSGSNPYGRPRFASVGGFQPARWSSMHGSGGRPVPPGITEAERGRRSSMYDRYG